MVIGKPIGGGIPVGAYGMSAEVAARLEGPMLGHDIDVGGVGGTLAGNALAMAAMRATLVDGAAPGGLRRRDPARRAFTDGIQGVIAEHGLPWHVQRLGCRAEYWFCPPPRAGAEAAAAVDEELDAFFHLWTRQPRRPAGAVPQHVAVLALPHRGRRRRATPSVFRGAVEALLA